MQERASGQGMSCNVNGLSSMNVDAAETAAAFPRPLAGKVVAVVHPAWHSCGSHQVFVSQVRTYCSLGATVISLALADTPGCVDGSPASKAYLAATDDLSADIRIFTGMPLRSIWTSRFLRAGKQWLHGNLAKMRLEVARLAVMPDTLGSMHQIDLIHCNHFFCMPVAERLRLRHGCPIVLDTHDLQARQYDLSNRFGLRLPPVTAHEDMLAIELDAMRAADILIHLNAEEAAAFQGLLPGKPHALLYPAVRAMPAGQGGGGVIMVASANYANFVSIVWFLREVLPRVPDVPVQILGNIDREVRWRASRLFRAHAGLFRGTVELDDLHEAYRKAVAVLLPTAAGHGISIKTIEALSCGAPLIATPLAFRGFSMDQAGLANVTLAKDAEGFASAMRSAHAGRHLSTVHRASSATRQLYERYFSADAYRRSLWAIVSELLSRRLSDSSCAPSQQPSEAGQSKA
jgi:polysaccharide biosynthesis protein PslH